MVFRVGQKVVCVNDRGINKRGETRVYSLKKGKIYEIRRLTTEFDDMLGILLVAIKNPIPQGYTSEYAYHPLRFRPVVSTDTGMAVLEQIRRDVTNKELRPIFEDEQV